MTDALFTNILHQHQSYADKDMLVCRHPCRTVSADKDADTDKLKLKTADKDADTDTLKIKFADKDADADTLGNFIS